MSYWVKQPADRVKWKTMLAIIDYQMGNLRSVQKGFEQVGCEAQITSRAQDIRTADKVVLPGVGAFGDAMTELQRRGLIDPVREAIDAGKPFLGICLGLQLLFDVSHEGGQHRGLGILRGEVVRFDIPREFKVPHMGWNQANVRQRSPVLDGIAAGTHFYFVHSYYVVPADESVIAVEVNYHRPFCAMIQRGNLFATQFHPEKSQSEGLKLLRNFANLS